MVRQNGKLCLVYGVHSIAEACKLGLDALSFDGSRLQPDVAEIFSESFGRRNAKMFFMDL